MFTFPPEVIRSFSVADAAPSAVVENISLPGISFEPGVPSTLHSIRAASVATSVPSAPTNLISPR